ncbi:MAG TPA: DEAD/DEAH box helicase family protein [Thauera aminoaromatica]|nr:DEAD/DEAH box helicase family protein [Thauera aminoaromatica]
MERPYQTRLFNDTLAALDAGFRRLVECMATGLGKTHTSIRQIQYFLGLDYKVIFIVDLDFVVDDTAAKLQEHGIPVGIIQAGKKMQAGLSVYVCSLQTLIERGLRPFQDEPRVVFILDECHIFAGPQTLDLLHAYPNAIHIGKTATPQRGDGTALGNFYEKLIEGPQLGWGMTHGLCSCGAEVPINTCHNPEPYLVRRIVTHAPPKAQDKLAWDPVEAWFQFAAGMRSFYFCKSAKHAEETAERFRQLGVGAEAVTAKSKTSLRKNFRARFRSYEILVVCTHSVGIKALDLPEIECVGVWRRISVPGIYQQMGGRGARGGKEKMVLLDGCGSLWDLGPIEHPRVYSLEGDPIKLASGRAPSLTTCRACGAVQPREAACVRCGGDLEPETPKVSKTNQLAEIKEVSLSTVQANQLRALIDRGMRAVMPSVLQRQLAKKARGEKIGRPIGPWFAVEWAVTEFKKRHGITPTPDVINALKKEFSGGKD